jgi:hypothetical protein
MGRGGSRAGARRWHWQTVTFRSNYSLYHWTPPLAVSLSGYHQRRLNGSLSVLLDRRGWSYQAAENIECASDQAAEAVATRRKGNYQAIEVWLERRRVAFVGPPGEGAQNEPD